MIEERRQHWEMHESFPSTWQESTEKAAADAPDQADKAFHGQETGPCFAI